MAYEFQKMTGIDPLCFCTTTYFEREKPNLEMAEYKMATNQGLIDIPRVFINDKGETYGTWGYIDIFFPRQKFDHGRADWLSRESGRVALPIPQGCIAKEGLQLVQAYRQDEIKDAVPIDRIMIKPGETPPVLMLPPNGKYMVRGTDSQGKLIGETTVVSPF
jgi:hypothetical protein